MRIMLGIPHQNWVTAKFFERFLHIMNEAGKKGYQISVAFIQGTPHDAARNMMILNFLASDCDWLLSVDDDVLPPVNILDMITDERPICAAYCHAIRPKHTPNEGVDVRINAVALQRTDDKDSVSYQKFPAYKNQITEVPIFGTGCFVARKDVFSEIPKPWFRFDYDYNGCLLRGEDVFFCEKAAEYGYKLYMDGNFVCDHLKEVWI